MYVHDSIFSLDDLLDDGRAALPHRAYFVAPATDARAGIENIHHPAEFESLRLQVLQRRFAGFVHLPDHPLGFGRQQRNVNRMPSASGRR